MRGRGRRGSRLDDDRPLAGDGAEVTPVEREDALAVALAARDHDGVGEGRAAQLPGTRATYHPTSIS